MSQFHCRCGFVMKFHTGVEEYDLSLVSNQTIEEIAISVEDKECITAEKFYEMIDSDLVNVMRCPNCHRLWLEQEDHSYRSYIPEPEQ